MTNKPEEKIAPKTRATKKKALTLHQKILNVATKVEYIKKEEMKGMGTGVRYDDLIGAIRGDIIEQGILVYATQTSFEKARDYGGNAQIVFEGKYDVHFVNVENPKDCIIIPVISHGMDGGDKAPGKAQTYALKIAMKMMFLVETGINDESYEDRMIAAELGKNISPSQEFELAEMIQGNQTLMTKVLKSYNIRMLNQLYVGQFEEVKARITGALEAMKSAGRDGQHDNS